MSCEALFNNFCFLFGFLPIVLIGYWAVPSRRWKLAWITAMSYVFYGFWDVRFVGLLAVATLLDFGIALRMRGSHRPKRWVVASVVTNLAILGFFKYAMFAADQARSIFDLVGLDITIPFFSIILPVGISFYTFQTLSYTIDVYRGRVEPTRDLLKYTAFVSLFPQLVAGPIVRYTALDEQLDRLPRRLSATAAATGVGLFTIGLFKKVGIADAIAERIDPIWLRPEAMDAASAWTATLGYTLQLYFDFSGYSDMAIGLGALLGLALPINFRAPYQAVNPTDFWRRWHISLSTFLRDYLYVPLGGNRKGSKRRLINLTIVMALGGLWHGAAWTFVAWGVFHGALLVLYQLTRNRWDRAPVFLQRGLTLSFVILGWVIFRSPDLSAAGHVLATLFTPAPLIVWQRSGLLLLTLLGLLGLTMVLRPTADLRFAANPWRAALWAALFGASLLLMRTQSSPFLYYQF